MVAPSEVTSSQQPVNSREKPIVFVGQSQAANWNVDSVYSDSVSGAFALTKHLNHLGRQKIAIITGRQTSTSASDRVAGYCMALADAKIPIDPHSVDLLGRV
jgi:LacI family transcriptional regulator